MEPKITPTDATLGASVTDIDLAQLDDATWAIVESAFLKYSVLIFPGQNLSDEQQVDFSARFGDFEYLAPDMKSVLISNQEVDGSLHRGGEYSSRMLRGNEGWHSDSSFMPLAAKVSILSAHVVPTEGGQTEWADMRASYDALDSDIKDKIADLAAYHSLYYSQAKIGHDVEPGTGYGFHREPPPLRPLVKVHPETGRKSLFIGRHAYGVPGLEEAESERLLSDLLSFACQAPRTYLHNWQVGDIVVWDNRCSLHRARPYDYSSARVMRHTRIAGDPKTEMALNTTFESNTSALV